MHGLQVCLIKYINVSATFLIMENHGKIMELCFLISVGTLYNKPVHDILLLIA